jgi:hypothetical protein
VHIIEYMRFHFFIKTYIVSDTRVAEIATLFILTVDNGLKISNMYFTK